MVTAVAMLLVWGVWALGYDGPGWIHLLLTLGVTLLIYRVVVRGTRQPPAPARADDARAPQRAAEGRSAQRKSS